MGGTAYTPAKPIDVNSEDYKKIYTDTSLFASAYNRSLFGDKFLTTNDKYQILTDSGRDLSGNDILGGGIFNYLEGKYGDTNSRYGDSNPFYSVTKENHLSDLYYGDKWRGEEIAAYQSAVKNISPYITSQNQDGTVDLYIPRGSVLKGQSKQETPLPEGVTVKGMKIYNTVSEIADYLDRGNGLLGRYKESQLTSTPVERMVNDFRESGYDWNTEATKELEYNKQYTAKLKEIADRKAENAKILADRERAKANRRKMAGAGGSGSSGRGFGAASDDVGLRLNKYTLLG